MGKMCVSLLGVLLLVLLVSSQVLSASNDTAANSTNTNSTSSGTNVTVTPFPSVNVTSKEKNGAEGTGGVALLLLPVALGASLLHSWS